NNNRFVFNAGEGTQRIFMEHRIRLTKVENVFLTHISTDTIGGVPGEPCRLLWFT
ncbi:unnamed protein product, partial [Sphacelaria rigidula]